jgi:hypothetical protein
MRTLLKTKSVLIGITSIVAGTLLVIFSPENKEIGVAMITSGAGTVALRDAIRKGK